MAHHKGHHKAKHHMEKAEHHHEKAAHHHEMAKKAMIGTNKEELMMAKKAAAHKDKKGRK